VIKDEIILGIQAGNKSLPANKKLLKNKDFSSAIIYRYINPL
jgi:hypothetical protein